MTTNVRKLIRGKFRHYLKGIMDVLVGKNRPKEYWDDDLDREDGPEVYGLLGVGNYIVFMIWDFFLMLVVFAVILAIFNHISTYILGHPQFLAGVIADLLVWICRSGHSCDFKILYPAFGTAQIIIASIYIVMFYGIRRFHERDTVSVARRLTVIMDEIQQLKRQHDWIPTKSATPDNENKVIVSYQGDVCSAMYMDGVWVVFAVDEIVEDATVNYWMPYPEPMEVTV